MIVKTQGIAVRIRPWSKTSHMVTWLTPDYGRVTTSIKGACRVKSAFLGQYDLGYTCELLFYRRDHDGVHAIRECAPLNMREDLRHHWRSLAAANYFCELLACASWPNQQDSDQLFDLLEEILDNLCLKQPDVTFVCAQEIALLNKLGLMPNMEHCHICNQNAMEWHRYSITAGHFLCEHAKPQTGNDLVVTLHRQATMALANLSDISKGVKTATDILRQVSANVNLALGIRRFIGIFMFYHLDISPAGRRTLFDLLAATPAQWKAKTL